MKKSKAIIASLLAVSTAIGLTACGEESNNLPSTSGNAGGIEVTTAATAATENAANQEFEEAEVVEIDEEQPTGTIKWLMYEDLLTNDAEMVALFESRYGGSIEQEQTSSGSAYFEKLATLIATDLSPDIVRYEWMSFPHGMSKNMYTPLDSYIDLDSDLWKDMKDVAEQFTYANKHYYIPYRVKTNFALNYNRLVLEEAGMDDPMDLYLADQWDWDAFMDIITEWCDKDPDNVGYAGVGAMSFVATTGTKMIDVTDTEIINNMKNENVQRCMDMLEKMFKENLVGPKEAPGYISPQEAFKDGTILFLGMDPSWAYGASKEELDKQAIENDMAFIPFPRDPNADAYYHAFDTYGYLVPTGAKNVKGAIDWITLNREEVTDPENIAEEKANAISTDPVYYPKCANADCNDTSDSHDDKNRHIFTDEENESGMSTCPSCGTARKEKYKVVYSEQQWDIYQELINTNNGKFEFLFDGCFGFSTDLTNLFQGGAGDGTLLDGPIFYGNSYTTLRDSLFGAVESYLDPYREKMAQDNAAA